MSDVQKGHQITSAFLYIQKVFIECQRLMFKIDNQLAPEWGTVYGSRITKEVSASLQEPDRWIPDAIFRVYESKNDKLVNKCVTVSFWGDGIKQPVITAGKIVYDDIQKRDHWDLWKTWFYWPNGTVEGGAGESGAGESAAINHKKFELDGNERAFSSDECRFIKEAQVFSWPLIDIKDDEVLIEKIIKPLKKL